MAGDDTVGEKIYEVSISDVSFPVSVLAGSMKCMDNGEPIAPSMQRLRDAVAEKRIVPYSAEAFSGWPVSPPLEVIENLSAADAGYDPERIYWRTSVYDLLFGNLSNSAGEAPSSRGFVSADDALMLAAALVGDSHVFNREASRNRVQTLYGLSLPYFAIWSESNDTLRDPQHPFAGDRAYTNEGIDAGIEHYHAGTWTAPADTAQAAAVGATPGETYSHQRDEAHLFNHGYVYWLATGDPRAALLQQTVAAYALASIYNGGYEDGRYQTRFGYQRTTLNMFSAMWKLRDVAQHVSGPLFWEKDRAEKMAADVLADWQSKIADLDARTDDKGRMMSAFCAYDQTEAFSNFMAQAYGPESAYLWASAGHGEILTRLARHMVIRLGRIGGARGLSKPGTSTILMMDGTLPTLDAILAEFDSRTTEPADTFDGSALHYTLRAYWLLRMAKDAAQRGWIEPVPGIDEAIAKTESARDRTTGWTSVVSLGWKHSGTTF